MGIAMDKERAHEHIKRNLREHDSLIGFFQAIEPPKIWLFFLIGPLAALRMRMYFLAVTTKGLHFHRLNLLGKFKEHDYFDFCEIERVEVGKGVLQRPMKFHFKNNRKIKVKAQLKGVEKVAKLTADVQRHIEDNIPSAK
jgi:hypothetical protein